MNGKITRTKKHLTTFSGALTPVALDAAEKRTETSIADQKCPFCLTILATTKRNFITHVARHMEEVALGALPIDDDSVSLVISDSASVASDESYAYY